MVTTKVVPSIPAVASTVNVAAASCLLAIPVQVANKVSPKVIVETVKVATV